MSTLEGAYWYSYHQETSWQRHGIYIYGSPLATTTGSEVSNKKKTLNYSSSLIIKAISHNIENDQSTAKSSGNYTARYWEFPVCLSEHHSSYSFIFLIILNTLP